MIVSTCSLLLRGISAANQAGIPLIGLFRFAQPPLCQEAAIWFTNRAHLKRIGKGLLLRSPLHLLQSWNERRRTLRELSDMQREEFAAQSLDDGNPVNRAKVALEVGDLTAVSRFWESALARYPTFAKGHQDPLTILIGLQCFDEAEALMLEGKKRYPRDMSYAEGFAVVAQARGDLQEAIRRWAEVRKRHPQSSKAYVQGVGCLIQAGDADAAEELAKMGNRRFPEVESTWMECARVAELRKDWPGPAPLSWTVAYLGI